ncbi:hypothetical protein BC829DRAFT_403493, partial [Chytridium lagenaria]
MDSVSFKVLNLIISSKPKSGPFPSIPSKDFVYLKLKGLQPDDVRAFLKMLFQMRELDTSRNYFESPRPWLCRETLKKNLAFCINDDVLQFDRVKAARISELLEGTIGDAILTQFERFSTCSSICVISGQYFELENANAVEKLRNINDAEGKPQVYFRHISITVAIYESIPIAERSYLDDSNRYTILPLLYHHFSIGEDMKRSHYFMTELTDLAESLSMIPAELDTPERRALWYSTLRKHNMQAYRICNQSISSMFMVTLPSEAIPKTFKLHLTLELINLNIEVGYAALAMGSVMTIAFRDRKTDIEKYSQDFQRLLLALARYYTQNLVKSVSEFDSFCNHLVSPFSVNFISNVAGFSLQALWPIMSMADTLGDHDLISCRQRILSHIKVARPVFYCLFKGDRRTARRHLRTLITPKSMTGMVGGCEYGLWMLDGDEKYRIEARGYFERIQANTFLTWMHGAKVLSSR